ncbi:TPA: FAD-dependent oxidoreductase, partial [Burkholderia aenigmatica]|nr:FAD-dependent oxidoreductase [Burkholderia aenigmatica]
MATMSIDYQTLKFEYRARAQDTAVHPVIVVGAGPVGLAAAIDLAQQGVPVVLLDDDDTLSTGSRAICFAKRTLEIFDRLGCGERFVDKGVSWHVGKVFLQDEQLYAFDLLPEEGHARPAFINLQQYYVEGYLADRAFELPNIDIRWKHKVTGIDQSSEHAVLTIETPEGVATLRAQYVIAADGSRSPMRTMMGLESHGRTFKDRFLIADVKMKAEFPTERWFWFDPPFHPNQSVLLHRQPDNVWRIDFQLGWDADPVAEKQPERVIPRVRALLGPDVEFELEWVSVYTFRCQRMESFRHGRVLFAGDSAHGVSPFGARGANSGVQDADNLAWKLKLVLDGRSADSLLDTYASEREFAADENIRNSTRSTDFITPKSPVSRVFRDATLKLARDCEFARKLVNSGRLSVPAVLADSPLNTPDRHGDAFAGAMRPGAAAADAPVRTQGASGWLLQHLGSGFTGVLFGLPGDAA